MYSCKTPLELRPVFVVCVFRENVLGLNPFISALIVQQKHNNHDYSQVLCVHTGIAVLMRYV